MKNFLCVLIVLGGLALIGLASFVVCSVPDTRGLTGGRRLGAAFVCFGSVAMGGLMVGVAMGELPSGPERASEEDNEEDADQ